VVAVVFEGRGQLLGELEAFVDLAQQQRAAVRGGLRRVAGDDEWPAPELKLDR
jgi:hypothetical protein